MGPVLEALRFKAEPYYRPVSDECERFEAALAEGLPVLLKGPTGCGKTRFIEHMAWRLERPLVTVACHEDLSAADLVGRWLLDAQGTRWQDGPLALAARHGALCYLDELVEARADAMVVVHPLTDTRRLLPIGQRGEWLAAHPDFRLVASFNPSPTARELKPSTRQRFCAIEFGYPAAEQEVEIVASESGLDPGAARAVVAFGIRTRRLQGQGLEEGASTRMLVHAGRLAVRGLGLTAACRMGVVDALSDDPIIQEALVAALDASF